MTFVDDKAKDYTLIANIVLYQDRPSNKYLFVIELSLLNEVTEKSKFNANFYAYEYDDKMKEVIGKLNKKLGKK